MKCVPLVCFRCTLQQPYSALYCNELSRVNRLHTHACRHTHTCMPVVVLQAPHAFQGVKKLAWRGWSGTELAHAPTKVHHIAVTCCCCRFYLSVLSKQLESFSWLSLPDASVSCRTHEQSSNRVNSAKYVAALHFKYRSLSSKP